MELPVFVRNIPSRLFYFMVTYNFNFYKHNYGFNCPKLEGVFD